MPAKAASPARGRRPHHHQDPIEGTRPDQLGNSADMQPEEPDQPEPCYCGGCDDCQDRLLLLELWADDPPETDEEIMDAAHERAANALDNIERAERAEEAALRELTRRGF